MLYLEERGGYYRVGLFCYIKVADFELSLVGCKGVLWKEHSFLVIEMR